jgi:hypothetical protein
VILYFAGSLVTWVSVSLKKKQLSTQSYSKRKNSFSLRASVIRSLVLLFARALFHSPKKSDYKRRWCRGEDTYIYWVLASGTLFGLLVQSQSPAAEDPQRRAIRRRAPLCQSPSEKNALLHKYSIIYLSSLCHSLLATKLALHCGFQLHHSTGIKCIDTWAHAPRRGETFICVRQKNLVCRAKR